MLRFLRSTTARRRSSPRARRVAPAARRRCNKQSWPRDRAVRKIRRLIGRGRSRLRICLERPALRDDRHESGVSGPAAGLRSDSGRDRRSRRSRTVAVFRQQPNSDANHRTPALVEDPPADARAGPRANRDVEPGPVADHEMRSLGRPVVARRRRCSCSRPTIQGSCIRRRRAPRFRRRRRGRCALCPGRRGSMPGAYGVRGW